jgi:hypothetical protein
MSMRKDAAAGLHDKFACFDKKGTSTEGDS